MGAEKVVWEVVEREGAGTTPAGYEEGCAGHVPA
jgi:hypothetical protein